MRDTGYEIRDWDVRINRRKLELIVISSTIITYGARLRERFVILDPHDYSTLYHCFDVSGIHSDWSCIVWPRL
jgi:hypothetical protein